MAMNGLPYYRRYPRDFIEGTVGMPFELKAIYSMTLDLIATQDGKLIDNPRYIAGMLGVSVRRWKSARDRLVESKWLSIEDGVISNEFRGQDERSWAIRKRRRNIPSNLRKMVWKRDGKVCQYCKTTDGPFHLDHVYPWSRGGRHTLRNLVVACAKCNASKADMTVDEWRGTA